jgi:hypothetical protein
VVGGGEVGKDAVSGRAERDASVEEEEASLNRLPDGWEVLIDDETGVDYFHHIQTCHVQWESPVTQLPTLPQLPPPPASSGSTVEVGVGGGAGAGQENESDDVSAGTEPGSRLYPDVPGGGKVGVSEEEEEVKRRESLALLGPGPGDQDITRAKSDLEQLKSFMAKLVLGNDFSGGVNGDSPALTVSLALTNLAAGAFGEMKRLQPVTAHVQAKWQREVEILKSRLPVQLII